MLSMLISNRTLLALGAVLAFGLCFVTHNARASDGLPEPIATVLSSPDSADAKLSALMAAIPEVLDTDRAFLWVRDPDKRRVKFSHGYSSDPNRKAVISKDWAPDVHPRSIPKPLLKRAFASPHAIFIDDIYDQPKEMLNADFQALVYENRALIHAPLYVDGALYGILQTDIFDSPRDWSDQDIALMQKIQEQLATLTVAYLQTQ